MLHIILFFHLVQDETARFLVQITILYHFTVFVFEVSVLSFQWCIILLVPKIFSLLYHFSGVSFYWFQKFSRCCIILVVYHFTSFNFFLAANLYHFEKNCFFRVPGDRSSSFTSFQFISFQSVCCFQPFFPCSYGQSLLAVS